MWQRVVLPINMREVESVYSNSHIGYHAVGGYSVLCVKDFYISSNIFLPALVVYCLGILVYKMTILQEICYSGKSCESVYKLLLCRAWVGSSPKMLHLLVRINCFSAAHGKMHDGMMLCYVN